MIQGKKVLALIPARGGSKGLPRKNVLEVGGKPLIAWTIAEAKKSKYVDRLILSSDDQEIIGIAKQWGCEVPFVRPTELARDDTPGIEPVLHGIEALPEKYDLVVLLQPTSPLRSVQDIDGCIERCLEEKAKACVSVAVPEKSPYWMYSVNDHHRMSPILKLEGTTERRQDLPKVYALNGAVYVADCEWLMEKKTFVAEETVAYEMPKERSIDIDTELDLTLFKVLIMEKKKSAQV